MQRVGSKAHLLCISKRVTATLEAEQPFRMQSAVSRQQFWAIRTNLRKPIRLRNLRQHPADLQAHILNLPAQFRIPNLLERANHTLINSIHRNRIRHSRIRSLSISNQHSTRKRPPVHLISTSATTSAFRTEVHAAIINISSQAKACRVNSLRIPRDISSRLNNNRANRSSINRGRLLKALRSFKMNLMRGDQTRMTSIVRNSTSSALRT